MLLDPAASGELADKGFVELAAGGIVDGLHAGMGNLELGLLQGAGEALVLPRVPFRLHEEAEALVEGERDHVGLRLLVGPGRSHRAELQRVELLGRRSIEHGRWLLPHW